LAWRPAIAPAALPAPGSFALELIAKGEALAGGGYCAACHRTKGGQRFAGGYAMATPFGVIYSTNITPDPETGIGTWSEMAFRRAMHEGVSRAGSHLFSVFSYDHFTRLSDEDVRALYGYFMTPLSVGFSIFSPCCFFRISSLSAPLVAVLEFLRLELRNLGPDDMDRQIEQCP
jgi:mono/diheme cytochrome c family protein